MSKQIRKSLFLSEELADQLYECSYKWRTSQSEIIRLALEEYLKRMPAKKEKEKQESLNSFDELIKALNDL